MQYFKELFTKYDLKSNQINSVTEDVQHFLNFFFHYLKDF